MALSRRSRRRGGPLLAAVVAALLVGTTAHAATIDPNRDPAEQRADVRAQRAELAAQLDALRATDEEVSAALADLDAHVRTQEALVADAQRALATATATAELAASEQQRAADTLAALETASRDLLVDVYVRSPPTGALTYLVAANPSEALARRTIAQLEARRLSDNVDAVAAARQDVTAWRARAEDAQRQAEGHRAEVAERLAAAQEARDRQQAFADDVQQRIDEALAESAALAELDEKLSQEIARRQEELARQLAGRGRSSPVGPVATPADIVAVRHGILVHRSIAAQVDALVAAAARDGLTLSGGGFRDTNRQVALRRQNCGGSSYAIYQMPSGRCRPPTAPPGRSMHERGLAIDFRCNGGGIPSRSSPCYRWLAAHAADYGLFNLPSEPWHWSTSGR